MLRLIIFIILLIASVLLGILLMQHPGFLLIVFKPWMVQMPFWFALLSLIVIFVIFYLLIDSIDRFQFLWFRMKNWWRIRGEHQSYSKTQHGLAALIEGKWKRAENLLIAGATQTVEPLMNYLGAAKAAHELQAYDRRDGYLEKAYKIAPDASTAIGITQAELEINEGQYEQAAATLNHIRTQTPKHARVLQLLEKIYVHLGDWQNLLDLLPMLRKVKILTPEQLELFEKNLYCQILQTQNVRSYEDLRRIWHDAPKSVRNHPDVICAYVKQLLRFDPNSKEAEDLIRKTLKYHYQAELVSIYSDLNFSNLNRQLVILGAWLKIYGSKPALLLALGKICVRVQLWGKAKDYFEKCLALGPNPEASLEYGKLLEHLDEPDEAIAIYRAGLREIVALSAKNEVEVATLSKQ